MGKNLKRLRNLSFRTAFIVYVTVFLLGAAALSLTVISIADGAKDRIYSRYGESGDRYYLTTADGRQLGEGALIISSSPFLSTGDQRTVNLWSGVSLAVIPVFFTIGIAAAAFLFYRNKLKRPLFLLAEASSRIGRNDLDFELVYDTKDEMGALCLSFETMRKALLETNVRTWRRMDERKQLNAAFSHDLRTPLTVLKGQSDLLLKYIPEGKIPEEKVLETLGTMKSHIVRLEDYTLAMSRLQKLEDIEIKKAEISALSLFTGLKTAGDMLCGPKILSVEWEGRALDSLHVDQSIVMQVFENLAANAVRFASQAVHVSLSYRECMEGNPLFTVTVSDDGPGFSEKDLKMATRPFYRSDIEPSNERLPETEKSYGSGRHFGMGLNICKILCERHGGTIKLYNTGKGAAVRCSFSLT